MSLNIYKIEDLVNSPFKENLREKYKFRRDQVYEDLCQRYDSTSKNNKKSHIIEKKESQDKTIAQIRTAND